MNTYAWNFHRAEGRNKNGLTGVVGSIHWELIATDGNGHTARRIDNTRLAEPDPDNFTPRLQAPDATVEEVQAQRRRWLGEDFIAEQEAAIDAALLRICCAEEDEVFSEE
jgi:hypothetical protein